MTDAEKAEILKAASARVVAHLEKWEVSHLYTQAIKANLIALLPLIIECEEYKP